MKFEFNWPNDFRGENVDIWKDGRQSDWYTILAKKGHNSVKILWMTSKLELDLYLMLFYPSVNFE